MCERGSDPQLRGLVKPGALTTQGTSPAIHVRPEPRPVWPERFLSFFTPKADRAANSS